MRHAPGALALAAMQQRRKLKCKGVNKGGACSFQSTGTGPHADAVDALRTNCFQAKQAFWALWTSPASCLVCTKQ
jgi:hypothetical protein